MKIITLLLVLFTLISCGVSPISKKPLTAKEKALERYRMMRLQNNTKKKRSGRVIVRPRRKKPSRPKIKYVDIKEQRIEIEQNLTFFCMSKRKDDRFNSYKGSCQNFSTSVQVECQSKFDFGDARLTRCIKSRLK